MSRLCTSPVLAYPMLVSSTPQRAPSNPLRFPRYTRCAKSPAPVSISPLCTYMIDIRYSQPTRCPTQNLRRSWNLPTSSHLATHQRSLDMDTLFHIQVSQRRGYHTVYNYYYILPSCRTSNSLFPEILVSTTHCCRYAYENFRRKRNASTVLNLTRVVEHTETATENVSITKISVLQQTN